MSTNPQIQSHVEFRESLKGQSVVLPNMYSLFPEWRPRLHPEYARARDESLNPWLERWIPDLAMSRKFQKAEFGLFAAILCANSSYEKLCTMSKSFAWYFVWDDLFDCGILAHDSDTAKEYREKSLQYFRYSLCDEGEFPDLSGFSLELQYALLSWDEIGVHIREVCSRETCEVLLEKKIYYISSMDTVDTPYKGDRIPSLKEYWDRREQTAGVYPVLATIPFIYGQNISRAELATNNMKSLWRHTSYITHMMNDMFSLRKEIRENQIENLIPILMLNEGINCYEGMQLGFRLAQGVSDAFHEVEAIMRKTFHSSSSKVPKMFIEGCKNGVMGLAYWSYTGQRYFQPTEIGEKNVIKFQI